MLFEPHSGGRREVVPSLLSPWSSVGGTGFPRFVNMGRVSEGENKCAWDIHHARTTIRLIATQIKMRLFLVIYLGFIIYGVGLTFLSKYNTYVNFRYTSQISLVCVLILSFVRYKQYVYARYLLYASIVYIFSLCFGFYDQWVYQLSFEVISGHTLHHMCAACTPVTSGVCYMCTNTSCVCYLYTSHIMCVCTMCYTSDVLTPCALTE